MQETWICWGCGPRPCNGFINQAAVEAVPGGWRVVLDGKPLNSPARKPLLVPTQAAAELIAAEWNAQGETIDKRSLRLTGFAALAVDVERAVSAGELLGYGETDLLLYREDAEAALQEEQRTEWDPWLRWAEVRFGTQYRLAEGVMPVEQPEGNLAAHAAVLEGLDGFALALLAAVVKPTTSLLLGLAFWQGELAAAEMLRLSQLEEAYNQRRWGVDGEAAARHAGLVAEFAAAEQWRSAIQIVS